MKLAATEDSLVPEKLHIFRNIPLNKMLERNIMRQVSAKHFHWAFEKNIKSSCAFHVKRGVCDSDDKQF